MNCLYCGKQHPPDLKYCPTTGKSLAVGQTCPHCGAALEAGWLYCNHCGRASGQALDGEIKQPGSSRSFGAARSLKIPCLALSGAAGLLLLAALLVLGFLLWRGAGRPPAFPSPLTTSPAPSRPALAASPALQTTTSTPAAAGLPTLPPIHLSTIQNQKKFAFVSDRSDGSPDWIVTGNGEIYLINADGSAEVRLTHDKDFNDQPVLSPDEQTIVFSSQREQNMDIYSMQADGSQQTRLTTSPAYDVCPAWSPDGQYIAFTSFRDGNAEIYSMKADGSQQTRLTDYQAPDYCPAWSPDGQYIAFTSYRTGFEMIYVMDAAGGRQIRLTDKIYTSSAPNWSPDGQKIVFQSHAPTGNLDIYLINIDGSGLTRLTQDKGDDSAPIWLEGGQKIAFISDRDGRPGLYVMNADGGAQRRLTKKDAYDSFRTAPFYASISIQPALPQQPALPLP
jgi:Tol biopolymer transport system component